MSIELFAITHGLDIQSEDFLSNANVLQGNGSPGGDGSIQDAAPIGSLYMRTDAEVEELQIYYKYRTTQNSLGDWHQIASKDFISSAINGVSWREPVTVIDSTTYADSSAFPTGGIVDGITLSVGDRVLFTDVTDGTEENIWTWDGTTWTEDANAESDGDAVLVKDGTSAESQWVYDGSNWVQIGSALNAQELQHIRDFIGKNGTGAESPLYTSTNTVTQGVSLEAAIGELDASTGDSIYTNDFYVVDGETFTASIDKLDTQFGSGTHSSTNVISDATDVTVNLGAIDGAIGDRDYTNTQDHPLDVDGETITASLEKLNIATGGRTYTQNNIVTSGDTISDSIEDLDLHIGSPNHTSTNTISNASSINDNLSALDATIGTQIYTNDNVVTDGETLTASVDAIDSHLGNNTFVESNFVDGADNITENLNALDVALNDTNNQTLITSTTNVGAQTVVDTLPIAEAEVAKWMIGVENTTDATNRWSAEVHAVHDGTNADHNRFSVVKRGANITGLSIDVDVNAGSFRLLVSSSTAVDVTVRRLGYFTIN